jgi:putative protease
MMSEITGLPELLAPAGSSETLDAAIGEGADAVYLGLKDFNARVRAKNFSYRQVEAIKYRLQDMQKKLYITLNTLVEEKEIRDVFSLLQFIDAVSPDGVIVQDLGMVQLIHEQFPGLTINASTQMNIASARGVNFLSRYGVSRVILSRELNLEQVAAIRQQVSAELELFIHGALCISGSGLCLFSSYLGGKSANRGSCAQPCRRLYNNGRQTGYFFSPYDLQMVDHIPDLADLGLNSFKIEGRLRSTGYIATVVGAYRYLLDNYRDDRERAIARAKEMLTHDFGRRKTAYHFDNSNKPDLLNPAKNSGTGIALGIISGLKTGTEKRIGNIVTDLELETGDTLRIHSNDDQERKTFKLEEFIKTTRGFAFHIPRPFQNGDSIYLIQQKKKHRKYPRVIPSSLSMFRKYPGKIPPPGIDQAIFKVDKKAFPPGIYVQTGNVKDLYHIQSIKPERVVITLNEETLSALLKKLPNTDFMPEQVVLYLDPWLPESETIALNEMIGQCIDKGYNAFVANNPGHLHMLKNRQVHVSGGPYLYSFNTHAARFFTEAGSCLLCMPYEMSKQSLMQVSKTVPPSSWMVPVFSYPRLFIVPNDLSLQYSLSMISDRDNLSYHLVTGRKESIVVPEKPFSLVDRIPWLKTKGFSRFLVDISNVNLTKNQYRKIMNAVHEGTPIEGSTRFNWKRGFYQNRSSK